MSHRCQTLFLKCQVFFDDAEQEMYLTSFKRKKMESNNDIEDFVFKWCPRCIREGAALQGRCQLPAQS